MSAIADIEIYLDESGYTGSNLDTPEQPNLFFAGMRIPNDKKVDFWKDADKAWILAAELCKTFPDKILLKGKELFTYLIKGGGIFRGIDFPTKCRVVDLLVEAIIKHDLTLYWDGFKKEEDKPKICNIDRLFFKGFAAFGNSLYQIENFLNPRFKIHLLAHHHPEIEQCDTTDKALNRNWPMMIGRRIELLPASAHRGIQIIDIILCILNRRNKYQQIDTSKLNRVDQKVIEYHERIKKANLWRPAALFLRELHRIKAIVTSDKTAASKT